jgi:ABC-2 type transport system ATP-binding protein
MQNLFFEVLREENEKGVTIFFSSHILSEVQRICDRVAIIRDGRIVAVEHVDELRSKQYKRVRVRLRDPADADKLRLSGRTGTTQEDLSAEYLYRGDVDELVKELARFDVEGLWIEDPPLEEIFLHYYEEEDRNR